MRSSIPGSRIVVALLLLASPALAAERTLDTFKRIQLTDTYYSEGAGVGDINGDGKVDVVYGPYWFEGPDFKTKHEIFPPKPQNVNGYANHFFAWVYDLNKDGFADIVTAGLPGTPSFAYENPGKGKWDTHWKKTEVLNSCGNESPLFVNIVGDEKPELVCNNGGFWGYASFDSEKPFEKWKYTPVSAKIVKGPFVHGQGVGDVDGDGKLDLIHAGGWFKQPEKLSDEPWTFNQVSLSSAYGGADMFAYDIDGDGDSDIITSLAAHEYGLAWYEHIKEGDTITFKQRLIMGKKPADNRYGVLFSEPHALALADIDGDGLKDIITGKTYWSHHKQSPMWDAGAVTYWFKLVRNKDGIDWLPMKADGEAGIGRQLQAADLNGDGLVDMVMGGMKGGHVLIHERTKVDEAAWQAAQPKVYVPTPEEKTGAVTGAIEGESLTVLKATGGKAGSQKMGGFSKAKWSGDDQLYWNGAKEGDKLDLELNVADPGEYAIEIVFTKARDYAIIQLHLDEAPLGKPIDLYNNPDVITTGVIKFDKRFIKAGKHTLTIEITGANEKAVKAYMVGLDYVKLVK